MVLPVLWGLRSPSPRFWGLGLVPGCPQLPSRLTNTQPLSHPRVPGLGKGSGCPCPAPMTLPAPAQPGRGGPGLTNWQEEGLGTPHPSTEHPVVPWAPTAIAIPSHTILIPPSHSTLPWAPTSSVPIPFPAQQLSGVSGVQSPEMPPCQFFILGMSMCSTWEGWRSRSSPEDEDRIADAGLTVQLPLQPPLDWAELPKLVGTLGTHTEQLMELGEFIKVLEAIKC